MAGRSNNSNKPPTTLLELANDFRQLQNSPLETDRAGWKTCLGICKWDGGEWVYSCGMGLHLDEVLGQAYQAGAFNGDEAKPLLAFLPHGDYYRVPAFLWELGRLSGTALTGWHEAGTIAGKIADALEKVARARPAARPLRTSDVKANNILRFLRRSKTEQTITAMHDADCGDRKTIKIRLEKLIDSGEVVKSGNGRYTATKPQ